MNIETIQKLVDHYKALPGLHGWGYSDCVAGVLVDMRIIKDRMQDYQIADALGIAVSDAYSIVSGPMLRKLDSLDTVQLRDLVVAMLEGLKRGEGVDWGPQI